MPDLFTHTSKRGGVALTEHIAVAVRPWRFPSKTVVITHTEETCWAMAEVNSGAETSVVVGLVKCAPWLIAD